MRIGDDRPINITVKMRTKPMDKHTLWMIIGCGVPLLLLFFAPLLGLSSSITIFLFVVAMFACHILMIGHHRKGSEHQDHKH